MNTTPELKELHFRIFEEMSQRTAAALKARGLRVPPVKLISIARTVVNAVNTGVDLYLRLSGREARQFVVELDTSLERYLDPYLRDLSGPASV